MDTLTLSHPAEVDILVDERQEEHVFKDETVEDTVESVSYPDEIGTSFRALVLQRNWVKNVISIISEEDLSEILGTDKFQMLHIKEKIREKGICRFKKKIGFFKYLVYEIQSFWDYDCGL